MVANSFLDSLRSEIASPATAYDKFIRCSQNDVDLHLFVEGVDDSQFYTYFCQLAFPNKRTISYPCGSKKGVIQTNKRIKESKYKKTPVNALFFVDKDLDDFLNIAYGSDVFVTKYYSYENYLVNQTLLNRVIDGELHVNGDFSKMGDINDKFNRFLDSLISAFTPFFARVIYFSYLYNRNKQKYLLEHGRKIELKKIRLGELFTLNDDLELVAVWDINEKLDSNSGVPLLNQEGVVVAKIIEDKLQEMDYKKYIRGKFELKIYLLWLKKLTIVAKKIFGTENVHSRIPLNEDGYRLYSSPRITEKLEIIGYINSTVKT